ncbi:M56 family metallopeptidase [Egibacter rhizosphaerae]|uniref:M56 family metallopeptidase n=1 Tax=Egibacter rhizosphaerae TaxID=1670831 RepID=A0A411YKP0_9ACTN|nr:M56 family metallopeptidase [Egibacter rhizosphaerae]QBI21757.1 M56 family metallopeptidase [Egibacter rhizosphaerae]
MPDGSGGFFLLLTESFAVRALLGSVAAGILAWALVRLRLVRGAHARRLLLLTPVIAVAGAGVVSIGEAFLPRLWLATTASGPTDQLMAFFGEPWFLTPQREIDLLLIAYLLIVSVLVGRRLLGVLTVARLVRAGRPPDGHAELTRRFARLAAEMEVARVELRLLRGCPGGAVATGIRRQVVIADPDVLAALDDHEVEGLLAHELAHIRRRDALTALMSGVVRDLTFFLPPVHTTARWLRREREESADELAAAQTGKPGALASSILAVWDRAHSADRAVACAAVPARTGKRGGPREAARLVTGRVERLVDRPRTIGGTRRRCELGAAAFVGVLALGVAVVVPAWLVGQLNAAALAVGYVQTPQAAQADDPPAFATFREVTPEQREGPPAITAPPIADAGPPIGGAWGVASQVEDGSSAASPAGDGPFDAPDVAGSDGGDLAAEPRSRASSACPCIEGRVELAERERRASSTATQMVWATDESWQLTLAPQQSSARQTRPLLTVTETEQQVGVFVLGAATR